MRLHTCLLMKKTDLSEFPERTPANISWTIVVSSSSLSLETPDDAANVSWLGLISNVTDSSGMSPFMVVTVNLFGSSPEKKPKHNFLWKVLQTQSFAQTFRFFLTSWNICCKTHKCRWPFHHSSLKLLTIQSMERQVALVNVKWLTQYLCCLWTEMAEKKIPATIFEDVCTHKISAPYMSCTFRA